MKPVFVKVSAEKRHKVIVVPDGLPAALEGLLEKGGTHAVLVKARQTVFVFTIVCHLAALVTVSVTLVAVSVGAEMGGGLLVGKEFLLLEPFVDGTVLTLFVVVFVSVVGLHPRLQRVLMFLVLHATLVGFRG